METCHCHCQPPPPGGQAEPAKLAAPVRSLPPAALGLLAAFFPKCPMCWAAYTSTLGVFGTSRIPYQGWLLPVLAGLLALHLLFLLKKAQQKGFGPFFLSLAGALAILAGRQFFPEASWASFSGVPLLVAGSLWNSFSRNRVSTSLPHPQ